MVSIQDFSPDSTGLNRFLEALESLPNGDSKLRIAYFGDSYIEGDMITGPLRDTLQRIFGGHGVGFVPITSQVAGFRQTIRHQFEGFDTWSVVTVRDPGHPLGPAGYCFSPKEGAHVSYSAVMKRGVDTFRQMRVFYGRADSASLWMETGKGKWAIPLKKGKMHDWKTHLTNEKTVKVSIPSAKNIDLYGVSFEDSTGVYVDNFSVRGNSGLGLNMVSHDQYRLFDSLQQYKLLILHFGLNVASSKNTNYYWYKKGMASVVKKMKTCFPEASILLIGCSDVAENTDGVYATIANIHDLIDCQRQVAREHGICFWNMFEAMGGDSSIIEWTEAIPPLANKDYKHLNFRGSNRVASLLAKTLLAVNRSPMEKPDMAIYSTPSPLPHP
jgi:hypothetical protein